ncbi:uncharacterized protein LOC144135234 [Amblyomma americanum]
MGCGAAKGAEMPQQQQQPSEQSQQQVPRAVAFDVPLGDAPPATAAAPPERFLRRAPDSSSVTAEALREKLAKAEQRRQEVLEERIRNSKMFSEKATVPPVTVTSNDA